MNSDNASTGEQLPQSDLKPIAFWQLHKNPILLRYMHSRMRWGGLSAALILTVVATAFTFLISFNMAHSYGENITTVEAYRASFLPVFFVQIIIMMFLGTGAVAGGITQEYEDGMLEYQRLTPMSPLAKIVGYLFGLPIREWFLLGVSSIVIAVIVRRGEIPFESIWRVYSIFFLSILLYHLMALVVVQSMKRKRVAGRVIQVLVLLLYIFLPMLSQFGLVFFEYLTVRPILKEHILQYLPQDSSDWLMFGGADASVPFFDSVLKAWTFSVLLQLSLIITFIVMLRRRWKDSTHHLMSKPFAILFYAFFMFLLVGNLKPIAKKGEIILSSNFQKDRIERLELRYKKSQEGLTPQRKHRIEQMKKRLEDDTRPWIGMKFASTQSLVFAVCALLGCIVIFICTPRFPMYLVGLKRAKNLNRKWIPPHWDAASGIGVALAVIAILIYSLYQVSTTFFLPRDLPAGVKEQIAYIPMTMVYAGCVVMTFYLVYEAWENKGLFLLVLCIWVLPVMIALVMLASKVAETNIVWVSSISPVGGYSYSLFSTGGTPLPEKEAFYFSLILQIIISAIAAIYLIRKKSKPSIHDRENRPSISSSATPVVEQNT